MILTRTRVILIGVAAAVLTLAVACGAALDGDSSGDGGGVSGNPESLNASRDDGEVQPGALPLEASEYAEEPSAATLGDRLAEGDDSFAPGEVDPQLDGLLDRKIIQSTSVDVGVGEVGRSFQDIIRIAETAGGFVASSSFTNHDEEQLADLTVRVPGDQYQGVLAQIRDMGEVSEESSDANDVTEEYTDLQARLRTLEATENRYLELLGRADEINDILLVQDRLDGVRGQIEQVQGRINLLEHLTDLATITVHLRPIAVAGDVTGGGGGLQGVVEDAWQASLDVVGGIAAGALAVTVFSWWLVPLVVAGAVGARWWANRRPGSAIEPMA